MKTREYNRAAAFIAALAMAGCGGPQLCELGSCSDFASAADLAVGAADDGAAADFGVVRDLAPRDGGSDGGDDSTPDCAEVDGFYSHDACVRCCAEAFPDGAAAFTTIAYGCVCAAATCQSACAATSCAQPPLPADGTCSECTVAKCGSTITQQCSASPSCVHYATCQNGCPP